MRTNIARVVEQFKQSWSHELDDEAIERAMRETGHKWRNRDPPPVVTAWMFPLRILFGDVACNHVPQLARKEITGSAYCTAPANLRCRSKPRGHSEHQRACRPAAGRVGGGDCPRTR